MEYNVTYRQKNKSIQAIISYKDSKGKWSQTSKQGFKIQRDAKPWISATIKELEDTISYIDPAKMDKTFEELFKAYCEHVKLYWEPGTIMNFDSAIKCNFSKLFNKKVAEIGSIHIQECVDDMLKKGLKVSTIKSHLVKSKTMFGYAIKHKIIKNNPVTDITLPENKTSIKSKMKVLTKSETASLLSKIKNTDYYLISLVAITCGLRIGEILGIKWIDLDEKNLMLTVNKQWKIIEEDPIIYGMGVVKRPNSNRVVPVPPATLEELRRHKKNTVIDISGRIFPYKNTNSMAGHIAAYFKENKFDNSIHDLRHTYASRLVASGLDFQTVAALIGDSVEIVIKYYSHFTPDMMEKAKKTIDSIF